MNHVRVKPDAIYWKNIGGYAISTFAICGVSDNGENILVFVLGKQMPITLTYAEARQVFAGWEGLEILPDPQPKKKRVVKKTK